VQAGRTRDGAGVRQTPFRDLSQGRARKAWMSFARPGARQGTMGVALHPPSGETPRPMIVRAQATTQKPAGGRDRGVADAGAPSARAERRLVREAQGGSKEAVEALFRVHWPRAHRAAYLVVHDAAAAEDIAQEGFLAALRAFDRFDRRRPFGPWLYRIVVNRAIDHARSRGLRREVLGEGHGPATAVDPSARPYSDEMLAALAALPPDRRAVIVLRYVLDFTPGEIARALDLPRGTVNSRLRRGLDTLRAQLPDEERR
jgi:RNA polymerase sigma-70 factor (ECF subfamily)